MLSRRSGKGESTTTAAQLMFRQISQSTEVQQIKLPKNEAHLKLPPHASSQNGRRMDPTLIVCERKTSHPIGENGKKGNVMQRVCVCE